MATKKPSPARTATPAKKRFKPAPWTETDTLDLEKILKPYWRSSRNKIPPDCRKAFIEHASQALTSQIRSRLGSASPPSHRRVQADLAAMGRACDRLRDYSGHAEAQMWLWTACNPPADTSSAQSTEVKHHISTDTRGGLTYFAREVRAVIPKDHEEYLISVPYFFAHDLRRLSLAIQRAEELLKGARPGKAEVVGGVIGELYFYFRQDTGLKPSIHGPFREIVNFAVARVFGEKLGDRLLVDRLKLMHKVFEPQGR